MININFSGTTVVVRGHAGFNVIGRDIVCAAISTLFFTFATATDADVCVLGDETKKAIAEDTPSNKVICEAIFKGCKLIETSYPDYVTVTGTLPNGTCGDV